MAGLAAVTDRSSALHLGTNMRHAGPAKNTFPPWQGYICSLLDRPEAAPQAHTNPSLVIGLQEYDSGTLQDHPDVPQCSGVWLT